MTKPPHWWQKYLDNTHSKLDAFHAQGFTDHLNNLGPDIKFTTEGEEDGTPDFVDINIVSLEDWSLKISI